MIDIIITTWQREWMTQACLEAIKKNTKTPHRIILVDNGSKYDFYNEVDIYIKLDRNYGLEYAKNLGMQFVESDMFVSMDNDILVYQYENKDWLERLVDLMMNYPEYGAIAARPQELVGTGMSMFDTTDEVVPFHHVPGYARLMRTDLVRKTGAWNEKRPLRGHEEMWIGQRFAEKNIKMGWANFVECVHLWGRDDEDMWGYPKGTESGHNPVWPQPKNNKELIFEKTGVQI